MGEITRRALQLQRMHIHAGAGQPGQLVDGRATVFEVDHHLGGDFRWKGRNTLCRHAVVARKDNHLRCGDFRPIAAAPSPIPDGQLLKPAQSARRFGQLGIARSRTIKRSLVLHGCAGQCGAKIIKGGKLWQHVKASLHLGGGRG